MSRPLPSSGLLGHLPSRKHLKDVDDPIVMIYDDLRLFLYVSDYNNLCFVCVLHSFVGLLYCFFKIKFPSKEILSFISS